MAERTRIVGIGNRHRGDDAAGPAVVSRLGPDLPASVDAMVLDGDPGALVEAMSGMDRLILVDALAPGHRPGSVVRTTDREAFAALRPTSSHIVDPVQVLALAEALDRLPASVVVYGVEGLDFGPGEAMSDAVDAGVEIAAGMILEEISDA